MKGTAHRQDHGIAEDFYQVLVHEAHVPGPKETQVSRPILLHGHEFLQKQILLSGLPGILCVTNSENNPAPSPHPTSYNVYDLFGS